jgi:hypothetical protein
MSSYPKLKPLTIIENDDGSMEMRICCAVCIKENRPSPDHFSFVKVLSWFEYQALEFFDSVGRHHYHCRQHGTFICTFGHRFSRGNLPKIKCPTCGYDVKKQREIEAEMEVCRPPRKPVDGRRKQI